MILIRADTLVCPYRAVVARGEPSGSRYRSATPSTPPPAALAVRGVTASGVERALLEGASVWTSCGFMRAGSGLTVHGRELRECASLVLSFTCWCFAAALGSAGFASWRGGSYHEVVLGVAGL